MHICSALAKKSTRGNTRLRSASSSAQRAAQTQQKGHQGAKQAQRVKAVRHTLLGTAIVDRQAVVELVPLSGHNRNYTCPKCLVFADIDNIPATG
jgi:hypothetical protein